MKVLVGAMVLVTLFLWPSTAPSWRDVSLKIGASITPLAWQHPRGLSRGKDALRDTVILARPPRPSRGSWPWWRPCWCERPSREALLEALLTPFPAGNPHGISYILAFNKPPLVLVGTAAIIVINYVVRSFRRSGGGIAALRQIDPPSRKRGGFGGRCRHGLPGRGPSSGASRFISSLSYTLFAP